MTIDDKTKVTLFSAMLVIPACVYTVFFIAGLSYSSQANADKILKHDVILDSQTLMLMDIRDRLIKIEANQRNK